MEEDTCAKCAWLINSFNIDFGIKFASVLTDTAARLGMSWVNEVAMQEAELMHYLFTTPWITVLSKSVRMFRKTSSLSCAKHKRKKWIWDFNVQRENGSSRRKGEAKLLQPTVWVGKGAYSAQSVVTVFWRAISITLVVSQGWYIMHLTTLIC